MSNTFLGRPTFLLPIISKSVSCPTPAYSSYCTVLLYYCTTVFAKIDLVKAHHQIPITKADDPKTAIATPFGLFEFLLIAFGLKNVTQALQRLKDNILMGLD
jgi:hypothetical protein